MPIKIILPICLMFFVFNSSLKGQIIFTGQISNDWNHPMNWQPQIVPTIHDDVIIPSNYIGIIDINNANASCKNLVCHGNQALVIIHSGWRLIIGGNIELHGNSSISGTGIIEFNSSQQSNITLYNNANLNVGIIEIKKQGELQLTSNLNIPNSTIHLISGTFKTNGFNLEAYNIVYEQSLLNKSFKCQQSQITVNKFILILNQVSTFESHLSNIYIKEYIYQIGTGQFNNIRFAPGAEFILDGMMAYTSVNELKAEGDISLVGTKQNTSKRFYIQNIEFLSSTAICKMTETPYVDCYQINGFQLINSCTANYLFSDFNEINSSQVNIRINGNVNLSKVAFANTKIQNGILIINNGTDLGNNSNIQFNNTPLQILYWIGGQGNWEDGTHWSYSSGGPPAGCIPDFNTDVIFDDQSGFNSYDSVIISNHIFVKNIDFESNFNKPILYTENNGMIHIRGGFDLSGLSALKQNMPIYFYGNNNHNLITNNLVFDESLNFLSSGTWRIMGDLNLKNGNRVLNHLNGKIITNGNNIKIAAYTSNPSKIPYSNRFLNIENSYLEIGNYNEKPGLISINSTNFIIQSSGSVINYNYTNNQIPEFEISGQNDLAFNILKFNHPLTQAKIRLNGKCKFKKIEIKSDAELTGLPSSITANSSSIDSLILHGGYKLKVEGGKFFKINKSLSINSGICNELAYLSSNHHILRAGIYYLGNTTEVVKNLICKGIEFTGNAPVTIENGADHQNNLGINFTNQAIGKLFFWNGEGLDALWTNGQNWNIWVEPHQGLGNDSYTLYNPNSCKPGFIDSVIFHIYSFPVNDTVRINSNCNFKGMNWMPGSGNGKVLDGSSLYSLNNYGGLRIDSLLQITFSGTFRFLANKPISIQTNNVFLSGRIQFCGYGSYSILDNIYAPNSLIEIYSGSFFTNNNEIIAKNLIIDLLPLSGLNFTFQAGHSKFTIYENAQLSFIEGFHQVNMEESEMYFLNPGAKIIIRGNKNNFKLKNIFFTSTQGTARYHSTYYVNPVYVNYIKFAANGKILGNNIFDSLYFSEGRIYELEYNAFQFINHHIISKGSPCFRTTIQSTRPGYRAFIKQANCSLSIDHARLRDIEAVNNSCNTSNYKVNIGSEDLGNNINWIFIPGNPIEGLGADTIIGCHDFPFEINTNGFGPYNSLIWDNGSTESSYPIFRSDTISVIVTYTPSCIVFDTRKIWVNNTISHYYALDSVSCFGSNDAKILANVFGGNGNYNGYWFSSHPYNLVNDSTIDQLSAGIYYHIAYQSGYESSCYDTLAVYVSQPDSIQIHSILSPISCYNSNDAIIEIFVTGGNGNNTYFWSNDSTHTSNIYENLSEGNYWVQVTDRKGCLSILNFSITNPPPLNVNYETSPSTCGLSDGEASLNVSGGTPPYQYLWSHNPIYNYSYTNNLSQGEHSVIIQDSHQCTDTVFFYIESVNGITATYSIQDATCNEYSNGIIQIYPEGGNGYYNYSILNHPEIFTDNSFIESLSAGMYIIQIIDSNSCIKIDTVYVSQPEPILLTEINYTLPRCNGNSDGKINVLAIGGTGTLNYFWPESNDHDNILENIKAGIYDVIITDDNGCSNQFEIYLNEPDTLALIIKQTEPITCYGRNDGKIFFEIEGGTPHYYYENNQIEDNQFNVTNLSPGEHTFTIEDINGCKAFSNAIILEPQPLFIEVDSILPGKCNIAEGYIQITVNGGTAPYKYIWDNGETSNVNSNAINGKNNVRVIDDRGCTEELQIELNCIYQLHIPELVTPNGDNFSEQWFIQDLYRLYPNNHVQIYNRWGNLVFEYSGYSDQFKGFSNTGITLGNGLLPESTYYYIINLGDEWGILTGFFELDY